MNERSSVMSRPGPVSGESVYSGVRVSAFEMPANGGEYGGDWCEVYPISADVLAFSIGDVCGHGIEKYPASAAVCLLIRDAAQNGSDCVQTLEEANRFLCRADVAEFATAVFGLLNTRTRTLTFANAGHPPPLVAAARGTSFIEFAHPDLLLGYAPTTSFKQRSIVLPQAALLVFYTDGVSEHDRKPLDGLAELRRATDAAYSLPAGVAAGIIARAIFRDRGSPDDASILTARTPFRGSLFPQ